MGGGGEGGGGVEKSARDGHRSPIKLESDGFSKLDRPLSYVSRISTDPHGTTDTGRFYIFDAFGFCVVESSESCSDSQTVYVGSLDDQICFGGCVDPHQANHVTTVDSGGFANWDIRASKSPTSRKTLQYGFRDIDYNPNMPHQIATGGEDGSIKLWDTRKIVAPTKVVTCAHSFWVRCLRFNTYHDEFIITAGPDSSVKLWTFEAASRTPGNHDRSTDSVEEDGGGTRDLLAQNVKNDENLSGNDANSSSRTVRLFNDHEESVMSLCWSATDAWSFASVSFDGKLVMRQVPSEEKYRILL